MRVPHSVGSQCARKTTRIVRARESTWNTCITPRQRADKVPGPRHSQTFATALATILREKKDLGIHVKFHVYLVSPSPAAKDQERDGNADRVGIYRQYGVDDLLRLNYLESPTMSAIGPDMYLIDSNNAMFLWAHQPADSRVLQSAVVVRDNARVVSDLNLWMDTVELKAKPFPF